MAMWSKGPLLAAMLLAGRPALAQCPPAVQGRSAADVAGRIDGYWAAQRQPGTYRALAGLGDPAAAPNDQNERYWNATEAQRALLREMLPNQQPASAEYWYPDAGACRLDYALDVADQRIGRLGLNHPYVAQWLRTQRAVFSGCQSRQMWQDPPETPAGPAALPPAMRTDDPAVARLQRDDRAYQSAALLFYRDAPASERAFRAVAASASPHAHIARYMLLVLAARGLDEPAFDAPAAEVAQRQAQARHVLADARAILADPRLADIHPLAQGMIGFLGYWTGDERVREAQVDTVMDALEAPLARIQAEPVAADRYARALSDIDWLRRGLSDEGVDFSSDTPLASSAGRALVARARGDPFAAWLLTAISPFERDPWSRPGLRWHYAPPVDEEQVQAAPRGPWAIVQADFATTYDPTAWAGVDTLTRETQACPSDDRLAALGPLFYHQVRTALMYGAEDAEGRPLSRQDAFAQALGRVEAWPWRQSVHYRDLVSDMLNYLGAAGRLAEARQLRDRVDLRGDDQQGANAPALILLAADEDEFVREVAAMPTAAQELVNLLPIPVLSRLSERNDLPAEIRARFARVAWSRLYALQRRVPRRLDAQMRALNPEITGGWTSRPGARPTDRRLLLDVLRSPGLNILITDHQRGSGNSMGYSDEPGLTAIDTFEHSDNNWWCAWQVDRHRLTASALMYGAFFQPSEAWDPLAAAGAIAALGPLLRASWLWRAQDAAEQQALADIPSAPRLLAERAIAWRGPGRSEGQDEALALAVRSTRYGCQRQGGHGAYSHAAHALLHARFPDSDAARRTRWWFDCSHFSQGCRQQDVESEWERWARRRYYY